MNSSDSKHDSLSNPPKIQGSKMDKELEELLFSMATDTGHSVEETKVFMEGVFAVLKSNGVTKEQICPEVLRVAVQKHVLNQTIIANTYLNSGFSSLQF